MLSVLPSPNSLPPALLMTKKKTNISNIKTQKKKTQDLAASFALNAKEYSLNKTNQRR